MVGFFKNLLGFPKNYITFSIDNGKVVINSGFVDENRFVLLASALIEGAISREIVEELLEQHKKNANVVEGLKVSLSHVDESENNITQIQELITSMNNDEPAVTPFAAAEILNDGLFGGIK